MKDFLTNPVIQEDMENIFAREVPVRELFGRTVLVSGATGMLASYLVYYLIWLNERQAADIRIIALVRNREKAERRFGRYLSLPYFSVRTDDICKPLMIEESVDYIVHAASLASPQFYGSNPVEVAAPNTLGTYYMLELAKRKSVRGFLYFSTGDIYGKMLGGRTVFDEEQMGIMNPLDEHSCYGESKRMGETWCASFAREYGVPTRVARIAHTYAPTMDIENDPRVFSAFMKCLLHGKDIVMLSDGTAKRPFCYITDAIAAFLLILLKGKDGEAYNVANTEQFISIGELADIISTLDSGEHVKVVHQSRRNCDAYMENRSNHQNCPLTNKLKALGWECQYDVKSGFQRVLRYKRYEQMFIGSAG
ncbi:NAD-dependent epimerase/dehydratase family protein [uncultured Selenomonas sp.]|uniref:NAD-dependent epimerase/dehydratase family protein n=1 Tax=uncultured Selenomonas sp. TaxID=159275 RepID=UPI00258FF47C|nr:NAD-dependent epimerase/dehydratase family protein [uncultured Selenomonas sp.]